MFVASKRDIDELKKNFKYNPMPTMTFNRQDLGNT